MPPSLTVGQLLHQLLHQLQTLDPDLPVRLAINPHRPFSHAIGRVVEGEGDDDSSPTVYIAETGQDGYLPRSVGDALGWGPENWTTGLAPSTPTAPAPDEEDAPRYLDGQDTACAVTDLFEQLGWTIDDNDAETVYTAPEGHLTARRDPSGWSFAARHTPEGDEVWCADFDPAVPVAAIAAITSALPTP